MTANERIDELIARAGSPVMVVKSEEKRASKSDLIDRVAELAAVMANGTGLQENECMLNILLDDAVLMNKKIRDMANTIDRLEAALSNVLNERDQLLSDLHDSDMHKSCEFCIHNYNYYDDGGESTECFDCEKETNDKWTWRGFPVKETQS